MFVTVLSRHDSTFTVGATMIMRYLAAVMSEREQLWVENVMIERKKTVFLFSQSASLMDFQTDFAVEALIKWSSSWVQGTLFPCLLLWIHWYILIMIMDQFHYEVIREWILLLALWMLTVHKHQMKGGRVGISVLLPLVLPVYFFILTY